MLPQPGHHRCRCRLPARDDKSSGDIVDAVTVFTTRNGEQGVLEESVVVGEGGEVVEHRPQLRGRAS